ncbi:MAG: hypothetical protein Q8M71_00240 [Thermodesulfovibrionales bacterium]|nr:hypothetical protein [Thermodesulfovibrionales bacterium]
MNKQDYFFVGDKKLLNNNSVAVYCSKELPLSIYHTANETFSELLKLPLTVAGGWQSAMEKRVLKNYGKESQADIIYFLAKGINRFILPAYLSSLMQSKKLLVISPFQDKKRADKKAVEMRDELILSFINRFLFLYIKQGGYLEGIFRRCLNDGKDVYMLEHQANSRYFVDGVKPLNTKNLREILIG